MRASKVKAELTDRISRYKESPDEQQALDIVRRLAKLGHVETAFRWARHARGKYPQSRAIQDCYRRLKKRTTRLGLSRARIEAKLEPTVENLVHLSDLLRLSGKWRQALSTARKADLRFPQDWRVQLALGKLCFDRFTATRSEDDGWTAVEHLDNARCLHPESYSTLLLLGAALTRLDSYDDALTILDEVLALWPGDPRVSGLRRYVLRCRREPQRRAASGTPDATAPDASHAPESLRRLTEIAGAVGAFRFDERGKLLARLARDNSTFDFSAPDSAFETMAAACRLDTHRIGLGDLVSCFLRGPGWVVAYRSSADGPCIAFLEGDRSELEVDTGFSAALDYEPAQATAVGEGAGGA